MENNPEAPVAPEAKSEATPINANQEQASAQAPVAPDMHGFTSEQLADMQKFFQANGGYEKVKSRISNPTPAPAEEQKSVEPAQPSRAFEPPVQPAYQPPAGSITQQEIFAKTYFDSLASQEKYSGIAKEISSGAVLKEMADLGIQVINQDGSINAGTVTKYLDRIVQAMPAKQSSAVPEASAAPTVDYIPVGEKINSMEEARAIIMQDAQLKRSGQAGHPSVKMAEDYLRDFLSKGKK